MDNKAEGACGSWGIMLSRTEHQILVLNRYNMQKSLPRERCAADIPLHECSGNRSIALEDPTEKQDSLKTLEGKLVHLDRFEGAETASACIVSTFNRERSEMIKDKQNVAEKLAQIASETKHVLKHLKPVYLKPITELIILTESESDFQPLAALITTREFRVTLVPEFTKQILSGLCEIHKHGIVHKDIRCSNILVQKHRTGGTITFKLKIAHFEKASHCTRESDHNIIYPEGSSQFASPEMQQLVFGADKSTVRVDTATDIFSLGCTIIEMVERRPPRWVYEQAGQMMQYNFRVERTLTDFLVNLGTLLRCEAQPDASFLEQFPSASDFVAACLMRLPANRHTCKQLEEHTLITGLQM
ncbi:uncharacterized protein LOC129597448 [Paramacrobiotus metropolitanus]|uniref:uncharacterized protein LOC129597448 n=1 Tax=Paramacrobiotus metropolitanus TaxID=2943436 RepID=UPI002445740A|nr:uncharacterized protein LOC129597448 [Paramacrobiotus metropolitanus]XP_055350963.1 uncharacterized protein LOC129597448 [Paramacrobiotus metropolitanus]XP_055350964.1 uncharacterized protein LOC129597448 [Paramacrobiotus metropolitanus]XP_055350965.1 uncharacterized protein LOC129597448 [Paramacrobiotus metropolitanus]XP_055350966.1 uncharacterized protein LOC129597448 [Paramacrobiotus metropolitanus]XP_055350967.1 uncharacterized protein LOC129597448 [Paramacrobiotus metropolitanus]XP_05